MIGRILSLAGALASGFATAPAHAAPPGTYTRNVAIVVYDGVELLDFAGPGEVFAAAARIGEDGGTRAFRVYTVAPAKAPIKAQGFVTVTPEFSIEDAPAPDVIVIPGGGSGILTRDPKFMAWVADGADKRLLMSVCTGAFVPAKAGFLDGATATTHYGSIAGLRLAAPKANVADGLRFADNGKVVTTAGVSAGIDGALHVVARLLGRYVADRTAEYMEYSWSPPAYLAQAYPVFNPSLDERGRARQVASIKQDGGDLPGAIAAFRDLTTADPSDGRAWYGLGRALALAGRPAESVPAYLRAVDTAPPETRGRALYSLGCALALTGRPDEALVALDSAVEAGFRQKWSFENDGELASIRADARFKKILERL